MKRLVNLLMIVIGLLVISCKKESDIKPWEVIPYEVEFGNAKVAEELITEIFWHQEM